MELVAINEESKECVAVKIIHLGKKSSSVGPGKDGESDIEGQVTLEQHIYKEIDMMKRLSLHSNIVKLLDVIFESKTNTIFTVMEYCSNGELFDLIAKTGGLSQDSAKFYFRQLIEAVNFIHVYGGAAH